MTPDVNVLVAAARPSHRHHDAAADWITEATRSATAAAPLRVLPMVAVGFVRVATDRRFHVDPTPIDQALATVAALLAQPYVRLAAQGPEWPRVAELCARHSLAGPVVSDVWIAASVLELGEHLVTFDRGFRRLLPPRHLTVLDPAAAS